MLKLLLSAGADVNASTACGWSPLQNAAIARNTRFAKLLLDAGADPNYQQPPPGGSTVLMMAVAGGELEIVRMFLNAGADVNAVNSVTRETALDIARDRKYKDIEDYLLQNGAKTGGTVFPNV